MAVWTCFGLLTVFCLFHVEAWSTYKECVMYEPGEDRRRYYCRSCIPSYESSFEFNKTARAGKWTSRAYCREFQCQVEFTPGCLKNKEIRVTSYGSCCFSCPGYCFQGGRIYSIGDIFKCLDGINKCKCIDTGNVTKLTNRAYNKDTFCEPIHYGACSLYEVFEQKPVDTFFKRSTCMKERIDGRQKDICIEYLCGLDQSCRKTTGWNKSADGGCKYCPGTCMYGGRIVAANSTFKCMDGVNTCACSNDGIVTQTSSVKPTINSMCKQYGKCKIYSRGEKKEGCSECRFHPVDFADICLDYTCATTNCSMPSTDNGCCPSCPGTCNYGGSVYKEGANFTCVNGFDKCSCVSTGNVILKRGGRWYTFPFAEICFSD